MAIFRPIKPTGIEVRKGFQSVGFFNLLENVHLPDYSEVMDFFANNPQFKDYETFSLVLQTHAGAVIKSMETISFKHSIRYRDISYHLAGIINSPVLNPKGLTRILAYLIYLWIPKDQMLEAIRGGFNLMGDRVNSKLVEATMGIV